MNNSFRFTDKSVKDIKPTDKRAYYHDTVEKDLVLQITPNGAKTFYLYKRIDGQPVRYKLGKPSDMKTTQAREEAIKARAMIASGVNPQKTRKDLRAEDTIETLYKKYMSDHRVKLAHSTYESYERAWNLHLKKAFGNKKISQLTSDTIKRFHKRLIEKPYCANRCVVFLKAMYNYVIQEGYYKGTNPAKAVKLNKEEARTRYLEHNEVMRFFDAIYELDDSVSRNAILMTLYTGARKSNILKMKWSEIDIDAKTWLIPKTKTGKNIPLPLADLAVELLKKLLPNREHSPYVFPSETSATGHIVDIRRVWGTLKKRAHITNLRLHDLRHNLATYMIAQGADGFLVQRTLTHKSLKSTQIYVNIGVEHLRDKLNETVNTLQEIGRKAKVCPK